MIYLTQNAIQKLSVEYKDKYKLLKLTKREMECLSWISKGKTAGEIANILKISESIAVFHQDTTVPIYLTYNKDDD